MEDIKELFKYRAYEWTQHALQRMIKRGIAKEDVKTAIATGEIIEEYPDDEPFPSCLVLGSNKIHVVVGIESSKLWIITAYRPDVVKWEKDLRTRKKEVH